MNVYRIKKVTSVENVDWNLVNQAEINNKGWETVDEYVSFAQMVYEEGEAFLLRLYTFEKTPWADVKIDGGPVYQDSCLEAFFLFDNKRYINFENNSLGFRIQGLGEGRHNRTNLLNEHHDFPVQANKTKDGWEIIIKIPFKQIKEAYGDIDLSLFKSGYRFKGNFYKTGFNPVSKLSHYYMWERINTQNPDFHQQGQFGLLVLE